MVKRWNNQSILIVKAKYIKDDYLIDVVITNLIKILI